MLSKKLALALLTLCSMLFGSSASAITHWSDMPMQSDEALGFDVFDADSSHGLWLRPIRDYLGVDDYTFRIGDDPGRFEYDQAAGTATLWATGTNRDGYRVSINLMLTERGVGPAGEGTAGPQFGGTLPPTSVTDTWTYFDLTKGYLTLAGLPTHDRHHNWKKMHKHERWKHARKHRKHLRKHRKHRKGRDTNRRIDITTFPNPEDQKPAQFGFFANWKDGDLGFSMWFDCESVRDGHCGDINVDLVPDPTPPIPEPSTALLLGLGCALLSGTSARRSRR